MEIGYFLVKTSLRWLSLAGSSRGKNRCVYPSATQCLICSPCSRPFVSEIILGRCGCHSSKTSVTFSGDKILGACSDGQ